MFFDKLLLSIMLNPLTRGFGGRAPHYLCYHIVLSHVSITLRSFRIRHKYGGSFSIEARIWAIFIVEFEVCSKGFDKFTNIFVLFGVYFFTFDTSPQSFDEDVV